MHPSDHRQGEAESLYLEWLETRQGTLPIIARRGLLCFWCRTAFIAGYAAKAKADCRP